jgi:hypothetical protein
VAVQGAAYAGAARHCQQPCGPHAVHLFSPATRSSSGLRLVVSHVQQG